MSARHNHIAAMMRAPVQASGVILEDNFQSGVDGAPLIGRATPTGGFVYQAGADTPASAYIVNTDYSYYKDGVQDQVGLSEATTGQSADTRESHYLPGVFQTNRYRVECDAIVYRGDLSSYYTETTIATQATAVFGSDNEIRVYLYPGGSSTTYAWLASVRKSGAHVEIARGTKSLVTRDIQVAEVIIERIDSSLFISIDGDVITSGTGYANDMPDTTDKGLLLYTRSSYVPGRLCGRLKVIEL